MLVEVDVFFVQETSLVTFVIFYPVVWVLDPSRHLSGTREDVAQCRRTRASNIGGKESSRLHNTLIIVNFSIDQWKASESKWVEE